METLDIYKALVKIKPKEQRVTLRYDIPIYGPVEVYDTHAAPTTLINGGSVNGVTVWRFPSGGSQKQVKNKTPIKYFTM